MDESRTFAQAVQARLATDILNGRFRPAAACGFSRFATITRSA